MKELSTVILRNVSTIQFIMVEITRVTSCQPDSTITIKHGPLN